jgi:hypothetical protein
MSGEFGSVLLKSRPLDEILAERASVERPIRITGSLVVARAGFISARSVESLVVA